MFKRISPDFKENLTQFLKEFHKISRKFHLCILKRISKNLPQLSRKFHAVEYTSRIKNGITKNIIFWTFFQNFFRKLLGKFHSTIPEFHGNFIWYFNEFTCSRFKSPPNFANILLIIYPKIFTKIIPNEFLKFSLNFS